MNPEFEELSERVNRNLIAFLGTGLDLGFTFARTAKIAADVENREDFELARKNAYRALNTIHQFQARIFDSTDGVRRVQIDNFPPCIDRLVFEKAWGQEIAEQLMRKKISPH